MLKKVLIGFGGLIALAATGIVGKFYIASPVSRDAADLAAPGDEATVAHGKYLANHVYACMACHSELNEELPGEPLLEGRLGSGRVFPQDPYTPGTIRSANLTPYGLKDWTDGEIVRAMREGIGRQGRNLFPMMPYMLYGKHMSKDEALAIVAYLRTLAPVENDPGITEVAFPVSMFVRPLPAPVDSEPGAAPGPDDAGRGAYLLKAAVCAECHHTMDDKRQPVPGMAYAGGTMVPHGSQILNTPNITPHETGIAAYTDEELERAIFEGKGRDGRDLFVMPWTFYGGMTPGDRKALVQELRKVTAVEHKVERLAAAGG